MRPLVGNATVASTPMSQDRPVRPLVGTVSKARTPSQERALVVGTATQARTLNWIKRPIVITAAKAVLRGDRSDQCDPLCRLWRREVLRWVRKERLQEL